MRERKQKEIAPAVEVKKTSRGILLIALGHPNYGKMAVNLAASIRYTDKTIPIHLIHSVQSISHLSDQHKGLFTSMREAPKECYTKDNRTQWIKAKTWMYDLSPFDETLFLDVDILWLHKKPVTDLFEELKSIDFTMQNRDFLNMAPDNINEKYSIWCNVREVKARYAIKEGKYYSLHSELVYFKKTASNRKYFDTVKSVFDNPRVKATTFADSIPDELAFAISCILENKYPHQTPWLKVFWKTASKQDNRRASELADEFYALSYGGASITDTMASQYFELAKGYFSQQGLMHPYRMLSKKSFLPERNNI